MTRRYSLLSLCLAAAMVFLAAACVPISPPAGTVPRPEALAPADTPVPAPSPPEKILLVGNSIFQVNGGMWTHLAALAASAAPPKPLQVDDGTQGGATLRSHHDYMAYFAPRMIEKNGYDVVVLQDTPEMYEKTVEPFFAAVRGFSEDIRAVDGAPLLFMAFSSPGEPYEWIDMAGIADAHRTIGAEVNVPVVPWGVAVEQLEADYPEMSTRGTGGVLGNDAYHPSPLTTYLGAAMLYAAIYGESPEGLAYHPKEISAEDAAFLQRVAWEAVQEWNAQ